MVCKASHITSTQADIPRVIVDEELDEEGTNFLTKLGREGGPLPQRGTSNGGDALKLCSGHLAVFFKSDGGERRTMDLSGGGGDPNQARASKLPRMYLHSS